MAAGLVVSACSAEGEDSANGTTQGETAEALVSCLADAGVRAQLDDSDPDDNEAAVWIVDEEAHMLCVPGSFCHITPGGTYQEVEDALAADWDEVNAKYGEAGQSWLDAGGQEVLFLVGDKDLSAEYAACLEESGYVDPEYTLNDPEAELAEKQRQVEANLTWADCARQNGWPQVKDPDPPIADDWATSPHVLLPGEMTEAQLSELLRACPIYDAEAHQAEEEEYARLQAEHADDNDDDWLLEYWDRHQWQLDPLVALDVPGFDGQWDGGERELVSPEDRERLEALEAMLSLASQGG
jgi:hypothetical protein